MEDTIEIEVTETHILKGRRADCRNCPIALAVMDKIPIGDFVLVGSKVRIVTQDFKKTTTYDLPRIAKEFIVNFDKDRKKQNTRKPFKFTITKQCTEGVEVWNYQQK